MKTTTKKVVANPLGACSKWPGGTTRSKWLFCANEVVWAFKEALRHPAHGTQRPVWKACSISRQTPAASSLLQVLDLPWVPNTCPQHGGCLGKGLSLRRILMWTPCSATGRSAGGGHCLLVANRASRPDVSASTCQQRPRGSSPRGPSPLLPEDTFGDLLLLFC